jgi:hypothetical protein
MSTEALQKKAMIAWLKIKCWGGTKKDLRIAEAAQQKFGTSQEMVRATKNIVDRQHLMPIQKIRNLARAKHAFYTLPHPVKGMGILPVKVHRTYDEQMYQLQQEYNKAVEEFVGDYDRWYNEAANRLADLFSHEDYPPPYELRMAFVFEYGYQPIPAPNHFIAEIEKEEQEKVRRDIEQENRRQIHEGQKTLWRRLLTDVLHMAERLSNPENIFRDSLVANIQRITDLIPDMMLEADQQLIELSRRAQEVLTTHDPEILRNDLNARIEKGQQAQKLAEEIEGKMRTMNFF